MCDEITERENEAYLNRRQLALRAAAVTAMAACGTRPSSAPAASSEPDEPVPPAPEVASAPPTRRKDVVIETPDGQADGVFVTPASGAHPGVIFWPRRRGAAPGLRGDGYPARSGRLCGAAGQPVLSFGKEPDPGAFRRVAHRGGPGSDRPR